MKELLEIRKILKDKKPEFIRQDAHKKGEISFKWRKPKGLQSKMRLGKKGYPRCVEIGWKSPKLVRGLDANGLKPVLVNNPKELAKIDTKVDGAVISKKVGNKKRIEIINKAKELNVTIINIADVEAFAKGIQEKMDAKKEKKTATKKFKETKVVKEEKKEKKVELSEEEAEKKAKDAKDKVLRTKK